MESWGEKNGIDPLENFCQPDMASATPVLTPNLILRAVLLKNERNYLQKGLLYDSIC